MLYLILTFSLYSPILHRYGILTSHSETRSDPLPYLFTSAAFVFNPFNESPLHFSQKLCSSHINIWGSLPAREAPGLPSQLAHVQPFATTKTTGKSRGLTTLDFAQLNLARPSGPPYLHLVYVALYPMYSIIIL